MEQEQLLSVSHEYAEYLKKKYDNADLVLSRKWLVSTDTGIMPIPIEERSNMEILTDEESRRRFINGETGAALSIEKWEGFIIILREGDVEKFAAIKDAIGKRCGLCHEFNPPGGTCSNACPIHAFYGEACMKMQLMKEFRQYIQNIWMMNSLVSRYHLRGAIKTAESILRVIRRATKTPKLLLKDTATTIPEVWLRNIIEIRQEFVNIFTKLKNKERDDGSVTSYAEFGNTLETLNRHEADLEASKDTYERMYGTYVSKTPKPPVEVCTVHLRQEVDRENKEVRLYEGTGGSFTGVKPLVKVSIGKTHSISIHHRLADYAKNILDKK